MTTFTRFHSFTQALAEKKFNLSTDTLKIALCNTAPVAATSAVYTDLTPITAENGYSAGGPTVAQTPTSTVGVYKLVLADTTITASGGTYGPFRYAVLYSDTATNKDLIGMLDYGAAFTTPDGKGFMIDFNDSAGAITI
jgi:hypothetical protein